MQLQILLNRLDKFCLIYRKWHQVCMMDLQSVISFTKRAHCGNSIVFNVSLIHKTFRATHCSLSKYIRSICKTIQGLIVISNLRSLKFRQAVSQERWKSVWLSLIWMQNREKTTTLSENIFPRCKISWDFAYLTRGSSGPIPEFWLK